MLRDERRGHRDRRGEAARRLHVRAGGVRRLFFSALFYLLQPRPFRVLTCPSPFPPPPPRPASLFFVPFFFRFAGTHTHTSQWILSRKNKVCLVQRRRSQGDVEDGWHRGGSRAVRGGGVLQGQAGMGMRVGILFFFELSLF